jgi:murein L,D-transpeptidase YafK
LKRSPLARVFLASAAIVAAFVLSGCYTSGSFLPMSERAATPLSDKMVADIDAKNMDRDAPILVRTFKEESELEVWKQDRTGRFELLKTYPICRWSGELGPKIREGDRQAPEGFYNITPGQMNPNSQYYLSFDIGYPNAFDRSLGRTGADIMVHGDCSSRGCYSMTDEQILEIYALGRDAFFGGQKSFQVQAYPFKMTPQNLARHRSNPNLAFWRMLKKGYDHFEVTHLEPKVNVCEKHYVFDAASRNGRAPSFSPAGRCPAYSVPEDVAEAVREKERSDDIQTAELIRRGTPTAPIRTNADGGMNPVFVAAVKRNQIGVAPVEALFVSTPPGTIPATVRPPRIPELADAPIMRDMPPAPRPKGEPSRKMAIAEPEQQPPQATSSSLFGGLFASDSTVGRWIGLRASDPPPAQTQAKVAPQPKAKPKPPAQATHVASHGAIRPKVADKSVDNPSDKIAGTSDPAPTAPPKPGAIVSTGAAPARTPAPPPASSAMNGSAPVVPTGTFDSRWSGVH